MSIFLQNLLKRNEKIVTFLAISHYLHKFIQGQFVVITIVRTTKETSGDAHHQYSALSMLPSQMCYCGNKFILSTLHFRIERPE